MDRHRPPVVHQTEVFLAQLRTFHFALYATDALVIIERNRHHKPLVNRNGSTTDTRAKFILLAYTTLRCSLLLSLHFHKLCSDDCVYTVHVDT